MGIAVAVATALVAWALTVHTRFIGVDTYTYLAAGERLNAGHNLYALGPGDRPVVLLPPYWTVPLLYPPPIAVLWRPLALIPGAMGWLIWWGAALATLVWSVVALARRPSFTAAALILLLSWCIQAQAVAGNVDAMILAATLLIWRFSLSGRERAVGALTALIIAVKLTPFALGWWLVVQRRWRAAGAMVVVGVLVGLISVVGAGLGANVEYLSVLRGAAAGSATPDSIPGLLQAVGVPLDTGTLVLVVLTLAGLGAMWLVRDRPRVGFALAIVIGVLGTTAVSGTSPVRLLAVAAPVAYPGKDGDASPDATPSGGRRVGG